MMPPNMTQKNRRVISARRRRHNDAFDAFFESGAHCVYDGFVEVVEGFGVGSGAVHAEGLLGFGDLAVDVPEGGLRVFKT